MSRIRPFQSGDEPALGEICLGTADNGGDATGIVTDDDMWAAVFAWPYAHRHPDTAFVVETDDGRVAGYIVSTPDTDEFEQWFRAEWWPRYAERWPRPIDDESRTADLLRYVYRRGDAANPLQAMGYPAHLHIDLLPELQGQGWGRRLVDALAARLRELGIEGVHLVAGAENAGAIAFYPRVGFTPLGADEGSRAFGMRL